MSNKQADRAHARSEQNRKAKRQMKRAREELRRRQKRGELVNPAELSHPLGDGHD